MKILFALSISLTLILTSSDLQYDVGAVYNKEVVNDYKLTAFGDYITNPQSNSKGGEVAIVKQLPQYNGFVEGAVGIDHSNSQYAAAKVHVAENLNNGFLSADAGVDHRDNYTNGSGLVTFNGSQGDLGYGVFAAGSVDSAGNKDYKIGGGAEKPISNNTLAKGGAVLHNKDLKAGAIVSHSAEEFNVNGFAGIDYNLDTKADDYNVGAEANKAFLDNKLNASVGVVHHKNGDNTAYAAGVYGEAIEGGEVKALASAKYDINNKSLINTIAQAGVFKDFNNGLTGEANVEALDKNVKGGATVNYAVSDASSSEYAKGHINYDFNAQAITNKEAAAGIQKDFGNGLNAGANVKYVNGVASADANAHYAKQVNNVNYLAGGEVNYDFQNQNISSKVEAKGGASANTIYNDYNVTLFGGALSDLKDTIKGLVGAKVGDLKGINSGSITAFGSGNLRGAKELGNIVGKFSHVIDASSNVNFEVTRFPDGKFEVGGCYNKQIDGESKINVNFKIDQEGHFTLV